MSRRSEAVKLWRRNTKTRIIDAFGGGCSLCDYNTCFNALELHHLDPAEKEFSFGSIRANAKSWDRIVEELRKCILVCSNCHKEIHAGISNVPLDALKFDETFADYKAIEKAKLYDSCPICNKKKGIHLITCSRSCAAKKSRKVDWDNIDVIDLIDNKKLSYVKIGESLGVSDVAVKKRYIKVS